jgi:2-oxoglutarate dehydrogenase E1 component
VQQLYLQRLIDLRCFTSEEAEKIQASRLDTLDKELALVRDQGHLPKSDALQGIWANYRGGLKNSEQDAQPALAPQRAAALLDCQTRLPDDFHPHPKIERAIEARRKMAQGSQPLDWSAAESLAFASLAAQGIRVRLSGQDSARGTFSQRHAVLHDYQDGHQYIPLQHVTPEQAAVEIYDSPLSEAGVLGFEYGYSLDYPDALILWEAQFGDFANAAQVLIDQFITAAEEKWRRLSGVVLLLPHGFEGMGPEHSSARLERFLQLGARDNIQVANPTTPAQYFHCLRRQGLSRWRKPLVIMTPKSLLRHPQAVSPIGEFSRGQFQEVIPENREAPTSAVDRVLLCSGKIYYDLAKARAEKGDDTVALVRLEQLYPFPRRSLSEVLRRYRNAEVVWCQEEPENMGAWGFVDRRIEQVLAGLDVAARRPRFVGRPEAAAPATGLFKRHVQEQTQLVGEALAA